MIFRSAILAFIGSLALALPAAAQKKYDPGATDTEIKIGNTNPYSGPASPYGTVGRAQTAYFNMVNDQGGVNGRKIDFITLDDSYSPPKTVEDVRRLIESDQVLFLFANVGTATNLAIRKYLNDKKIPQLFVSSGFSKWADPVHFPWTIGWWASYYVEGEIFGRYVLTLPSGAKVGMLFQNDNPGKEVVAGLKHGLGDNVEAVVVSQQSYESTDPTVDSQVVSLASSGANVFLIGASPKFVAQAIRKADNIGWKPLRLIPGFAVTRQTC